VRRCRPEHHVARADHLDPPLIRTPTRRRPESRNERDANALRIVGIGRDTDDVTVENDDLSLVKLARSYGRTEHQAVGLIFCGHEATVARRPPFC